jgi:hypothetical protein
MKFVIFGLVTSFILAEENLSALVESSHTDNSNNTEMVKDLLDDKVLDSKLIQQNESESNFVNQNSAVDNLEPKVIPIGLNNIDNNEEGNWILKKLWWQEGQNVYNDILKINDELIPLSISFLVLKNDIEKQFLQQWQSLNIDEEALSSNFDIFKARILSEKDKKLAPNENEQLKITKLENSSKTLDGLKKDFEDLFTNQSQLDEGFRLVNANLRKCRNYETESWNILREIAKTLDDQKAKYHYQEILAHYQNTKNLFFYLKNEYFQYMQKLAETQSNIFKNIKDKLQTLANNGYSFEKAAIGAKNIEQESTKASSDERTKLERQKIQQEKIDKANSKKSFIDKLYTKLNSWFSKIF